MRFLYICFSIIISATFGLQGADFDIYPSFSNIEDETPADSTEGGVGIGRVLSRVGVTLGVAGGVAGSAYIGFGLAKRVLNHLKKKSDTSWTDDLKAYDMRSVSGGGSQSNVNTTMIDEMKKEQEELWRFIHSLFKNQEEMMVKLDKSMNSGVSESALKELGESFDFKISDLSRRLDTLETRLKSVEKELPDKNQITLTQENVQGIIQSETKEISNAMVLLKKEIKNQMLKWLKDHDDAMVEKIRYFGEDIKKLVKNENSSKNDKNENAGSKTVKPKPQVLPTKTNRK